jgi:hypothetical protein
MIRMRPVVIRAFLLPLPIDSRQIGARRRPDARNLGERRQKLLIAFAAVASDDAPQGGTIMCPLAANIAERTQGVITFNWEADLKPVLGVTLAFFCTLKVSLELSAEVIDCAVFSEWWRGAGSNRRRYDFRSRFTLKKHSSGAHSDRRGSPCAAVADKRQAKSWRFQPSSPTFNAIHQAKPSEG